MRYEPNGLLVCPSNPKQEYVNGSYGVYAGSLSDVRMDLERAGRWMNAIRTGRPYPFLAESPALWGDRVQVRDYGYGFIADSNHRDAYGPLGGYVSHVDGTVRWYDIDEDGSPGDRDTYAKNGLINSATYIPVNSLYPWPQGYPDDSLHETYDVLLVGGNATHQGDLWRK